MSARVARKGQSKAALATFMLTMIVFGALFVPTAILLLVGMMPTMAALLIDNEQKKSATVAIGLMNAAGVLPFVVRLWSRGQTLDQSMAIIQQPMSWLFMYGAAAFGWLIVYSVPSIVHVVLAQRAKLRIADIESRHHALAQQWGEEVKQRANVHG